MMEAYADIAGSNGLRQPGAGGIMLEFEVDYVDTEAANCSLAGLGGRQ
jgi:hypothetical protein